MEYDERNSFLMAVSITYNRREADKNLGYNFRELKDKIQNELDAAQVTFNAFGEPVHPMTVLSMSETTQCVLATLVAILLHLVHVRRKLQRFVFEYDTSTIYEGSASNTDRDSFILSGLSVFSSCPHVPPECIQYPCAAQRYKVWDISGEDHSAQDLAADKRATIERRLREEDEAADEQDEKY